MNHTSLQRLPRGVSAVLIGRSRVTVLTRAQAEPRVHAAAQAEFAPGELEQLLRGLVAARELRGRVAIGFEPTIELFATDRRDPDRGKARGSLLDSVVSELGSNMVGRELDTSLPADLFSTVILAPGGLAREARRGLGKLGGNATRLISTTHALYRLAVAQQAAPRAQRVEIRVLTGAGVGLALLAEDGHLLARHVFEYSQAREHAVIGAARRLAGVARDSLRLGGEPLLILHESAEDALVARAAAEIGIEACSAPPLELDARQICVALARCAFRRSQHVNLLQAGGHGVGSEPAAFPFAGVAGVATALIAAGFWLQMRGNELDTEIRNLDAEQSSVLSRFGQDIYELRDQADQTGFAAHLLASFAQDRTRWAPLLLELPRIVPEGMAMHSFEGSHLFYFDANQPGLPPTLDELASNRWCELRTTAGLANGDAPPQVQQLTASLQSSEVFQRAFRRVTGASVVLHEQDEEPWSEARVRCLTR